jgi:hypothetical protein
MKNSFFIFFIVAAISSRAQEADHIYSNNIRTVKLFKQGDVYSYPVLGLNSGDQLELHFDDLETEHKNYYYSFQLCNADWTPANIQTFDYIKGFQSNRISTYRYSSISLTRYTHYQLTFPEKNLYPTRSGNYLLKVFEDDDQSRLIFTRRFLVVDNKAAISAQVQQPLNAQLYNSHQRLQVAVSTAASRLNTFSPQDLKVVILQNNVWATSTIMDRPAIYRGNYYEYTDEDKTSFPATKEWRWLDLRSLELLSDRMQRIVDTSNKIEVYVKPDIERGPQVYVYYNDLDGIYTTENRDGNNPYWQSDYAYTHFTFVPPGRRPYQGKSLHIFGELTNYYPDESSRMQFNDSLGVYEKTLFLKQGYYNYSYVTVPDRKTEGMSFENTEGNYWGTENNYMILVYFRPFGARADELIGFSSINSVFQR